MTSHSHPRARARRQALRWLLAAAGLALSPALRAADPGVGAQEIRVGHSMTTGGEYGAAVMLGISTFLDAANAAGGVQGRRIVLRTMDDGGSAERAAQNARQLVGDGVFVLFGSLEGGPSTAVARVAGEARVPFIGPMAGSPGLRRPFQPMVFPVRAEHREEFRALMTWGQRTGLRTVGLFHSDSDTGREHLANVTAIARDLGMQVALALPFKSDIGDAELDAMARRIVDVAPGMVLNHGSAPLYQRLIAKSRAAGARTAFMGVNSGSSQIAAALGPLAQGMVFAQVVPSPWERKHALAREFQDAMRRARPDAPLSYGAIEGYMTAKALVMLLDAAGRDLTREGLLKAMASTRLDLGGITLRYAPDDHAGSSFVDLSIVSRDGRFLH